MSSSNTKIVHETEAQRRHPRVKIPAQLKCIDSSKTTRIVKVIDLSASGFAILTPSLLFKPDWVYSGELLIKLNTVKFHLPVTFKVVYYEKKEQKTGCVFEELTPEHISILRLLITKYLTGDLTSIEDIVTTMSRDNYTKARKKSGAKPLSGWKKIRALVGTGIAACLGLLALAFITNNLYQYYFLTYAVTALVDMKRDVVRSPTDGFFEFLTDSTKSAQAGTPLAIISSPVASFLKNTSNTIPLEDQENLLATQQSSLIRSPYDATFFRVQDKTRRYAVKGEPLFELIPTGSAPFVTAMFKYTDSNDLAVGKKVTLWFPGDSHKFSGTITNLTVDIHLSLTSVLTTITPDTAISVKKIEMPIFVTTSPQSRFLSFIFSGSTNNSTRE